MIAQPVKVANLDNNACTSFLIRRDSGPIAVTSWVRVCTYCMHLGIYDGSCDYQAYSLPPNGMPHSSIRRLAGSAFDHGLR